MEPTDDEIVRVIHAAAEGGAMALGLLGWVLRQVHAWQPGRQREFHQMVKRRVLRFVYFRARGREMASRYKRKRPTGGDSDAGQPDLQICQLAEVAGQDDNQHRQPDPVQAPAIRLPTVPRRLAVAEAKREVGIERVARMSSIVLRPARPGKDAVGFGRDE